MRLLIVEDTRAVADILFEYFTALDFDLDYAATGTQGLQLASAHRYDAILLDIMLPGLDGYSVCRRLRERGVTIPIIMLTARDAHADVLSGLDFGADDYVVKPFDLDILEARLRAVVRRSKPATGRNAGWCGLNLNVSVRELEYGGACRSLSPIQCTLLQLLMQYAPEPVSREVLEEAVWQNESPDQDLLRRYIYQLRTVLRELTGQNLLATVPKFGYRLVELKP